ncbi:MAG: hypothetical protein AAF182_04150 [Pseudomonadota bacterium]
MRKFLLFTLFFILPASAATLYYAQQKASTVIYSKTAQALSNMGFSTLSLPTPQIKTHQALFSDIKLDPEGFSEIKYILLEYDPLTLLSGGSIESVKVVGLSLTGEIKNFAASDTSLGIAGWNRSQMNIGGLSQGSVLVEFKDTQLYLLTEEFGGLSIESDIQLRPTSESTDIKGHINTRQKYFGFESKISGFIKNPDLWQIDFEMNNGRITLDTLESSRISGNTKISYTPAEGLSLFSKLDAGGLSLLDTPWQNASSTIEYQNNIPSIFLGAKSIGVEGMELSLQYQPEEDTSWAGAINAPNINAFLTYMDQQGLVFSRDETLEQLSDIDNIEIQFSLPDHRADLVNYNIINYEKDIDIAGKLKIE